jgi:probable HAF family extracellular repeat protein
MVIRAGRLFPLDRDTIARPKSILLPEPLKILRKGKGELVMRRIAVLALSVILAVVVMMPTVFAQGESTTNQSTTNQSPSSQEDAGQTDAQNPNYAVQDLGTLGGTTTSNAHGINNGDEVVGSSDTSDGGQHAFLYSDGVMSDLNSLIPANSGWVLLEAQDINDNGHIVGTGFKDGSPHAFLLAPDITPPEVTSTIPTNDATGVSTTTPITATFSEDVDVPNNDTWFTVVGLRTGRVTGQLSYDAATKTATFQGTLSRGDVYTATITTEVKDNASNALAQPYTWRFTTAGPRPKR